MIDQHYTNISSYHRNLQDFAKTRRLSPASKRLYSGASMDPYDESLFREHNVKRGLRNADGSGVVAGLTRISEVYGYRREDGEFIPDEGRLIIRGYDIADIIDHAQAEDRFGYEELAYLLITGNLPNDAELESIGARIGSLRLLEDEYVQEFPISTQSISIMNVLQRAVLLLYAFDADPDDTSAPHEVDVALSLLARLPRIAAIAYITHNAETRDVHVQVPAPNASSSMAEAILEVLRGGGDYTHEEAMLLDVMLMLHAEHGGGNNSTFTCRVLSSSGTDAYSAYAGAIGSLKGPLHGGANIKVTQMHADIREHVHHWDDDGEVADYLAKILRGEAFDGSGLIYGMGHAIYTLSDPRAQICKRYARTLAEEKGRADEFELIERIERLAPEVMRRERGIEKPICANIDLYSGFIYSLLGIPEILYTPLFAVARMAGWAAHRMEELYGAHRIIRPAYNAVMDDVEYVPIDER